MDHSTQPILRLRGGGADQKRKEARKRKFEQLGHDHPMASAIGASETMDGPSEQQAQKRRKQALKSPSSSVATADAEINRADEALSEEQPMRTPVVEVEGDGHEGEEGNGRQPAKSQRFIVFIGNLPYTATTASITAHFAKVRPTSIRHRTDKGSGKSKGFAFLEFAAFDRMKTCLRLYHHSMFDDGQSSARKINVELTVGGGGAKSTERKSKLEAKNWKLSEERRRRAEEEAKVERKEAHKKGEGKGRQKEQAIDRPEDIGGVANNNGDIHPSRRSRMSVA